MQNAKSKTLSHAELLTGRDEGFLNTEAKRRIERFLGRAATIYDPEIFLFSEYTMDEVRAAIYALSLGEVRVLFLQNAAKLREDAQNALLKTLEEPPNGAYILFLAPDRHAFLPTVVSRMTEHRYETTRNIQNTSREIFRALLDKNLVHAYDLFDDADISISVLLTDLSAMMLEDCLRDQEKTAIMKASKLKRIRKIEELALRAVTPVNERILLTCAFHEIMEEYE